MKKIVFVIITTLILCIFSACSREASNSASGNSVAATQGENQTEKEAASKVDTSLPLTYKVNRHKIYIDVPDWQKIDNGLTHLFILNGQKYVSLTACDLEEASSMKEAYEISTGMFIDNIQNSSFVNELTILSESTETVNGVELYCFEGEAVCAGSYTDREQTYDAYMKGFSFIMDGIPCCVVGSVTSIEQKQSDIDDISKIIEQMKASLRSEE